MNLNFIPQPELANPNGFVTNKAVAGRAGSTGKTGILI